MTYNNAGYFVATYFPPYFQTAIKTTPSGLQTPVKTRSGRGFKSLSETFKVIQAPDNYDHEDDDLLMMLALMA